MDEISQLKVILKNSFAGIKADMSELKTRQEELLGSSYSLKQDVEKIKEDYVTKDKLNVLKIKIGEISDTLKKIWDLDMALKELDEKKTDKKDFESRFEKLREEIAKKLSDMNSAVNKKVVEYANSVNKNIEDVNNNTAKIFAKISEQMKIVATKNQLKELVSNVTEELTAMKKEVADIRKIKETITAAELERRSNLLNARVDLLAKEVIKANQNVAQCITSEQVKNIVEEINREFAELRTAILDIGRLKKYVGIVESESLSKKEFASQLAAIHSEIDSAKRELRELRDNSRSYARNDYIEKSLNRIESTLMRKILDLEKEVFALRRFERRAETEISEVKKEEKIQAKPERAEFRISPRKEIKPRKPYFALSIISIILIVLAFLGLAGAIISYFAIEPLWTNYLTLGAVILFVVGIILRIIVIKKRK